MNNISSLERVIVQILTSANIPFEKEKIFVDCYNGKYRYDFYLPELRAVLEITGAQHYEFTPFFYKNKSDFTKAQERDRRKISYCLAHNIALYIIPYWEISNIHSINDVLSEKFLALDKFHNDKVWRQPKN